MPFSRPSLDDLTDRIIGDFEGGLNGADGRTSESVLNVLATVLALASDDLYGYLAWIARQVLPDTAEAEMLDRHGGIWGIQRQAGAYASGTVVATGEPGAPIAAGTILRRADGREYATDAAAAIDATGTAAIAVTAVEPGLAAAADGGIALSFLTPVDGVDMTVAIDADGLTGGVDSETDESYLRRILTRIQEPPHGGAAHDYTAWAREVDGVTRAWCDPLGMGPGTVVVRFMMDATYTDGIPLTADIAAVADHIAPLRPATAEVHVYAPLAVPLNLVIAGLDPDQQEVKDAIDAEVADLVLRESAPGGTLRISHIREAISTAAGEVDHTLVSPTGNVTHAAGEIAVRGVISWV